MIFWRANCSYAEIRAMWVTRYQMDSRQKIDNFIEKAKENGFNTLFVQVLGRGVAFYDSKLIPKVKLDFDPLAYTVEKAHNKKIKIHAWINAYFVWSANEAPTYESHVVNLHPDWLLSVNNSKFLDPSNEEVKKYLYDVYMEVAQKYNVDGIMGMKRT